MSSKLIITKVEALQGEITKAMKGLSGIPGIYTSLNKTQKSTDETLKKAGIDTNKLFYIDCVSANHIHDDTIHIPPRRLDLLGEAISAFIKDIDGEKFLIIDAISTLLIYNNENMVAEFVQKITELGSKNDVRTIAFSPETKGEELLNKIFNFFDEVKKDG